MQVPRRRGENKPQTKKDFAITREKYEQLRVKLKKMLKRDRPRLASEVQRLGELGDFSENAEYQIAKGKLRGLNNRIDRVRNEIDHAEIIEPDENKEVVKVGHSVEVEVTGKRKIYQILGSGETDPSAGIISRNSPLGVALLGKKPGQIIQLPTADKTVTYKILDIK